MEPNNFVLNIATVNGSGSQSANQILLKSLFRMGIPVGGKNVFPSNIAGLPTWFWIRASSKGYIGRKKLADIVIALNPQTAKEDIQTVAPGGLFLFNSDIPLDPSVLRKDVGVFSVPFKKLTDAATESVKMKKFLTNVIYVGVVARLLRMNPEIVRQTIKDMLGGKVAVLESNLKAFEVGYEYAGTNLKEINVPHHCKDLGAPTGKVVMDGNSAAALGMVVGGCTFASWYPITPSTSLMDSFGKFCGKLRKSDDGKNRYAIIQAEDELAAMSMVLGAGWSGARAMTATSGPGFSLMSEGAGYAYFAEIPSVIWNVQRVGPSTGLPTRTLQGDLLLSANMSHGDKKHPLLIPGNIQECYEFGQTCFDLAERLQQLVIVLSDLDLGMNLWVADEFEVPKRSFDRGKVVKLDDLEAGKEFVRYKDIDADGICYRTLPGTPHAKAAYFTRGSGHNSKAQYTERSDEHEELLLRLEKKWETAKTLVPKPEISVAQDSEKKVGLLYYGSTMIVIPEVIDELGAKGTKLSLCRLRAYPFSSEVENFLAMHSLIYVIDQNRDAQMLKLLSSEFPKYADRLRSIRHFDGTPITSDFVVEEFAQLEATWN